jgi:hypothetical protein
MAYRSTRSPVDGARPITKATIPKQTGSAPLLIANTPDPQTQAVARSVDHLAAALVTSTERLDRLQAAMDRSTGERPRTVAKAKTDRSKGAASGWKSEFQETARPSQLAVGMLSKTWHRILDTNPTDSAKPHIAADGTTDYWLVPRGADKPATKVLPIGGSAEGVVVHNLEDGRDYTVTPSGEWREGAIAPAAN